MGAKVEAIFEATHGEVGVIEGWGGLHMLELIPRGISAINRVWQLARQFHREDAYQIFQGIVPQIVHSLTNGRVLGMLDRLGMPRNPA
jgi:hypothetical protein